MDKELKKLSGNLKNLYSLPKSRILYLSILVLIAIVALIAVIVAITGGGEEFREVQNVPLLKILGAGMLTLGRIVIAYVFAVLFSVPLALLTLKNKKAERILLPIIDILQSVPTLAFFPILVFLFVQFGYYNMAAIVIFFFTMLWTMIFNLIGGLKIIPREILAMSHVFHITKGNYLRYIIIPAITPQLVTSTIIAWSGGWNIAIVAEVLHTYLPAGATIHDLPGIGSELVKATTSGSTFLFLTTITVMISFIIIINVFVWQSLLSYAQKFRFE